MLNRKKAWLALGISLVMTLGLLVTPVLAAEGNPPADEPPTEVVDAVIIEADGDEEPTDGTPLPKVEPVDAPAPEPSMLPASDPPGAGNDLTPPVLTNIDITTATVAAPGQLTIDFSLEEEGAGLKSISFSFTITLSNGATAYANLYKTYQAPITSGDYSLDFEIPDDWRSTTYKLTTVFLDDAAGNPNQFRLKEDEALFKGEGDEPCTYGNIIVDIVSENTDITAPQFVSVELIDDNATAPGEAELKLTFTEEDSGVVEIDLGFSYQLADGSKNTQFCWLYFDEPLFTGTHSLTFPTTGNWPATEYTLDYFYFKDAAGNSVSYSYYSSGELVGDGDQRIPYTPPVFTVTESTAGDITPPVVKTISFASRELTAPGLLHATLEVEEEDSGIESISLLFYYTMTNGKQAPKFFHIQLSDPLFSGTYDFSFEIGPMVNSTTYELAYVEMQDKAWLRNGYSYNSNAQAFVNFYGTGSFVLDEREIEIENIYNITLNIGTDDDDLAEKIEGLDDGDSAAIDYTSNTTVGLDVFKAVAGKDVNLIFFSDNNNVQWIFNGSDVDPDAAKDIDLAVYTTTASGTQYDLDDDTITVVQFADNGTLPGTAQIRLNTDELMEMHQQAENGLFATYHSQATGLSEETTPVWQEEDLYSVFEVTHNSTFVISLSDPAAGGGPPDPGPNPGPDPKPDPNPGPGPGPNPTPKPGPDPTPTPNPDPDPAPNPTPDPDPAPTKPIVPTAPAPGGTIKKTSGSGSSSSAIAATGDSGLGTSLAAVCVSLTVALGLVAYKYKRRNRIQ